MAILGGTRGFTIGFITGFGAGMIARDYLPEVRAAIKPLLKTSLRSLLLTMEKSRELAARFGESVQDNWAEVQEEMKAKNSRKAPAPRRRRPSRVAPVVPIRSSEATQ